MRPLAGSVAIVVAFASGVAPRQLAPLQSPLSSALVELHVVAARADGSWISGLTAADFEVLSDGEPRQIQKFSDADRPVAATLLVDVSRSCWLQPPAIKRAIEKTLVDALRPGDRVRFGVFGGTPLVITDAATGWREGVRAATRVLDQLDAFPGVPTQVFPVEAVAAQPTSQPALRLGPSPIWDAVDAAVVSLEEEAGRRAILLLTDGRATGNVHGLEEVLQRAVRAAVFVSAISEAAVLDIEQGGGRAARIRPGAALKWLAENTGGSFNTLADPTLAGSGMRDRGGAGVDRALVRAFGDVHHAYTIGFAPVRPDGQWHGVEVRVKRPGVTARARRAYLAVPGRASARAASDSGGYVNSRAAGEWRPL